MTAAIIRHQPKPKRRGGIRPFVRRALAERREELRAQAERLALAAELAELQHQRRRSWGAL